MPRLKLLLEYDGGPFVGWQRQINGRSVQQTIEEAFLAFSGETVTLHAAGRTDAGVHALGQVAHVDLVRPWLGEKVRDALNALLRPAPIAVLEVEEVKETFDARFSATKRHYLYRILCRRAPAALEATRVWSVRPPLDEIAMQAAAQSLLGHHDFSTFRAAACQARSPLRTLDRLDVRRDGERIEITASARSFLHSQVRSMVGTLVKIGEGRWPVERAAEVLSARRRAACGPLAPPHGLFLAAVDY